MTAETIPALLTAQAEAFAAREAIVDDGGRLDYAALNARSAARAAQLVAMGVNKGHRVGLLAPNGIDWALDAYAIMRIGAVLVPLSTLLRTPELQAQLSIAGVRHLLAVPTFRGRDYRADIAALDRAKLASLRNIWWADARAGEGDTELAAALETRVRPADDMAVIFTSGSRGAPKGVIHTHAAAIRATEAGLAARCVTPGARIYLPMPFFWIGGFGQGLLSALIAGATLLTEATPEPRATLRFLSRERVTLFRGWPDQAARIAAHPDFAGADLSSLTPGSLDAVLPLKLRARPGARANLFGMTETFGSYAAWPLDQDLPPGKEGSCGRPLAGVKLRIVDPETRKPLPAGVTGAIEIGGRNLMRGICGREREEVFTPDGWYAGGDLGRLDGDGFLYFGGRADDMIKLKGATVYPSEVEAALEAIPEVARAFATNIALDGAEAIGAAVVLRPGAHLDQAGLAEQAKARLSAFKVPSCWAILDTLDALPRGASGKIDKAALQALLADAHRAGDD